jgi:dTDP-4-dehydrorhamnose reductase
MLVIGGSGYLGGWVIRLACADWDVSATYLSHAADETGIHWRQLDMRDEAAVKALVDGVRPQVVIHTAALNPGQGGDFDAVNGAGTRHVACAAAGVGARLIHLSTDVLFDGQKGNYVEEDPPNPITPYGRSKALAEEAVLASSAEAVVVRTSLIYGWRPRADRNTRQVMDALAAGRPVRLFTDEVRCPVWVESLAAALIELASLSFTGVLHVAGAQALSRYEFGVRLLRFHGVDPALALPALSHDSGLTRPLDCTLDCSRARALLQTPLPGVDEVLAAHSPSP